MKTKLLIALAFVFLAGTSCEKKIDLAKEQEAIKAVFEADRAAYFKQDYAGVGDCWIKEPSTTKIWLNGKEETRIVGWDNIDASQKKEAEDTSWDRNQTTAKFSNYQIDIMGKSAWVYCETNWEGKMKGEAWNLKQGRIAVLKKVDGNWKYAMVMIYIKQ